MCDPVEQAFHSMDRFDDQKIGASETLLRHLCIPVQILQTAVGLKISDQAFKPKRNDPGASVDLECLLKKSGKNETDRRGIMPNSYGLAAISAGEARQHSAGVAWTPKPEEPDLDGFAAKPNPFHGEIIKPMDKPNIRSLAAKATLLWVSPGVALGPFEGRQSGHA
jgi:hypothetical protein